MTALTVSEANRGLNHRPKKPNYPLNFVWTVSHLSLIDLGLFSLPIERIECK